MTEGTNVTHEATRLAACPFCGGACAITKGYSTSELPWSDDGGDFFRVYCSKCQSRQLFHRTEAEAIEAWNRRAAPTAEVSLPAVSEEAERVAFEAWAESQNWVCIRNSFDEYIYETVRDGWSAWLARAQSAAKGGEARDAKLAMLETPPMQWGHRIAKHYEDDSHDA